MESGGTRLLARFRPTSDAEPWSLSRIVTAEAARSLSIGWIVDEADGFSTHIRISTDAAWDRIAKAIADDLEDASSRGSGFLVSDPNGDPSRILRIFAGTVSATPLGRRSSWPIAEAACVSNDVETWLLARLGETDLLTSLFRTIYKDDNPQDAADPNEQLAVVRSRLIEEVVLDEAMVDLPIHLGEPSQILGPLPQFLEWWEIARR